MKIESVSEEVKKKNQVKDIILFRVVGQQKKTKVRDKNRECSRNNKTSKKCVQRKYYMQSVVLFRARGLPMRN